MRRPWSYTLWSPSQTLSGAPQSPCRHLNLYPTWSLGSGGPVPSTGIAVLLALGPLLSAHPGASPRHPHHFQPLPTAKHPFRGGSSSNAKTSGAFRAQSYPPAAQQ